MRSTAGPQHVLDHAINLGISPTTAFVVEVPRPSDQGDHQSMLNAIDLGLMAREPSDGANGSWCEEESIRIFTIGGREQVSGQRVSTGTDIFLLGIVLYELVTGSHPFRSGAEKPPHQTLRIICEEEPPPPSAAARHSWKGRLRGDFDKIVAKAMEKKPERRYASVEALAADIRRFLAKEPVSAQGDGLGYRAGKFVRRRWAALSAAALRALP